MESEREDPVRAEQDHPAGEEPEAEHPNARRGRPLDQLSTFVARTRTLGARWSTTPAFAIRLPALLLFLITGWYALRFSQLVIARHEQFGSFDYDLGIYDQGIWLLGRGRQFLTVRGLPFLGHHWNPAVGVFVPFYQFGAGPNFLNVAQACAVASGAVPTYFAARKLLGNSWFALVLGVAYLGHPSSGWLIQELFHPETMAIPFVLAAWAFAEHERWRWYAGAVVAALLWKEDIALAVAMLGLVIVVRKNRRYGLITFVAALAYFVFATKLMIPQLLGRSAFYEDLFGPLGKTPTELARNAVVNPDLYFKVLREHQAENYADQILRPFGYVGLLSPTSLLIGVPQFLVNLLNTLSFIWDPKYHYVAMPLVSTTVAMVRGIAGRTRVASRWGLVLLVGLFTFGVRNTGIGPWSEKVNDGFWPNAEQSTSASYRRALAFVPEDPSVVTSSPYFLTPHLTHRFEAYTFPNPWKISYWGAGGEVARGGDRVDYVVMNEGVLGPDDRATYDEVVVRSGVFSEVHREGSVVVWRRTEPGLKRDRGTTTATSIEGRVPAVVTASETVAPNGTSPTAGPTARATP